MLNKYAQDIQLSMNIATISASPPRLAVGSLGIQHVGKQFINKLGTGKIQLPESSSSSSRFSFRAAYQCYTAQYQLFCQSPLLEFKWRWKMTVYLTWFTAHINLIPLSKLVSIGSDSAIASLTPWTCFVTTFCRSFSKGPMWGYDSDLQTRHEICWIGRNMGSPKAHADADEDSFELKSGKWMVVDPTRRSIFLCLEPTQKRSDRPWLGIMAAAISVFREVHQVSDKVLFLSPFLFNSILKLLAKQRRMVCGS